MQQMSKVRVNGRIQQRGASLLEGIAYLGVAAIVVLGAVALLTSAFSGANTNKALEEITSLRLNVKKLAMGQTTGFGTGTLNSTLVTAGMIPTTLTVTGGGTITNAWNGTVTVTGATTTFTVTYTQVPQDVCTTIVSAQGSSSWLSVAVNGTSLTPPINATAAAAACSTSTNQIVWTGN